jgi:hypothetical protein
MPTPAPTAAAAAAKPATSSAPAAPSQAASSGALTGAAAAGDAAAKVAAYLADPQAMQRASQLFRAVCTGYCHTTQPAAERVAPNLFDCEWLPRRQRRRGLPHHLHRRSRHPDAGVRRAAAGGGPLEDGGLHPAEVDLPGLGEMSCALA